MAATEGYANASLTAFCSAVTGRAVSDVCRKCGIKYADFRTGETYHSIYCMMWSGSDNPEDWRYKRRHTVLGFWHAYKKQLWEYHLATCGHAEDCGSAEDCAHVREEQY